MVKIACYCLISFLGYNCLASSDEHSLKCVVVENQEVDDIVLFPTFLSFLSNKKYKKEDFTALIGESIEVEGQEALLNKAKIYFEISGQEEIPVPLAVYNLVGEISQQELQMIKRGVTPKIGGLYPDCYLYCVKIRDGSFIRFDGVNLEWSFDGFTWHEGKRLNYKPTL